MSNELTQITSHGAGAIQPVQQQATPGYLLQLAVQQGADLEKLERLMALQERWEAAEAKRSFVAAMAAFKAEPMTIFKKKQVGYTTKDGDFVGYTHARLSDVTDVVVPAMGRHGLSHRWDIRQDGGRIHVSCVVTHRLGHSEAVVMDSPPDTSGKKNPLQQIASATSYLQRYTLLAVTGMATNDMDNDASEAGGGADTKDKASDVDEWIKTAQATTTDADAAKVWQDGGKALTAAKDRAGYGAFKAAVVAHRTALKAALDERTAEAEATPVDDDFVRDMDAAEGKTDE